MSIRVVTVPAEATEQVALTEIDGGLDSLQAAVGGWIEAVGAENYTIYLDEEGKLNQRPYNRRATKLAHRLKLIRLDDVIVGDAVVTGFDTETGENTDAPNWALRYLTDCRG